MTPSSISPVAGQAMRQWPGIWLASYAILGGLLSLAGWAFDRPQFTDWLGSGISQMPNNALHVSIAGLALLLLQAGKSRAAAVLGGLVGMIGAATFFEHLSGVDLGIDRLLISREWGQHATMAPGRMGFPASLSLTLIGFALVLANRPGDRRYVVLAALVTGMIAMLSIVGYAFNADPLFTVPRWTAISVQTSTMILALATGLVICCPDVHPMKIFQLDSAAGCMVRRALPGVILLPLVLGWLFLRGERAGLFDTAFAMALLVIGLMALLSLLLWWTAAAVERHEGALYRSREQLGDILDSITDGFLTVDSEWRVVYVNEQIERRSGLKRAEMVGRNIWEVFPAGKETEAYRQLQRAMTDRCSTDYEVFFPPWQKWLSERAYPTPEGGLALYSEDITARRQAAARLRDSEERMQLAISIAAAGTWDLDLTTGVNHWSDSHFTLLGHPPTADRVATESMWRNSVVPEDLAGVINEAGRASVDRDMFRSEHRIRRADNGEIMWVKAAGRFFYDDDGKPARFVGVFFDVTAQKRDEEELKRLAAQLRQSDQRKDEFLATLAHELRNPLAPVLNSLEILKCSGNDARAAAGARTMIERQIAQMVHLIDDLLDIGRINQDKLQLRKETVDLGIVLHQVVEAAQPAMAAAGHEFVASIPEGGVSLDADPVRIAQVFGNLLTNACKYTPPGGRIELNVERHHDQVAISVKDSGVGIPSQMLDGIFDPFAQVDRTLERSQGGLGIGLTLVKRLVELHGGTVSAVSEGQGRGSEFTVTLPVAAGPPSAHHVLQKLPDEMPPALARRILVVDDNEDSAQSLSLLLELKGHEVRTARDGLEGVECARSFEPDLILLDIGMPGMNGYDACRALREMSWRKAPVLVALTGWGMEKDRRKSSEAGFDWHLVKPVDPSALLAVLADAHAGVETPDRTAPA